MANSVAALQPDSHLIERYRQQLHSLKDSSRISENEYYFLRSHPKPLRRLEDKTRGDLKEYTDKLPEELLAEFRSEIEIDVKAESQAKIERADSRAEELSNELTQVLEVNREISERLQQQKTKRQRIANVVTRFIAIVTSLGIAILLFLSTRPLSSGPVKVFVITLLTALTFLNLTVGFTTKGLYRWLHVIVERALDRHLG